MATKRKLDYSKVNDEIGLADHHGVVTSLSPIKKVTPLLPWTSMERKACVLLFLPLARVSGEKEIS